MFDFGDTEGVGYNGKLQHPLGVHYCAGNKTLYVADTYNHKIKMIGLDGADKSAYKNLKNWIGTSKDKNPRVVDGITSAARLNEPNGCWAKVSAEGNFEGLYIADTGNNCVRFAHPDGRIQTLELQGVPDVRSTNPDQ